ncbi:MAG: undecaprenyl/decaprenyl-phosphate alpha-N-acetylglucosaminyl 1-phosphate transferase [Flavobacteriaceae bacterium]
MTNFFEPNIINYTVFAFVGSFLLTFYLIPKIINVVNHKQLMDSPNSRSSHEQLTPTFGGVSFYLIIILALLFLGKLIDDENISLNIVAAITILLFTGLKDDLVVISNFSKLIGQISAVCVFLYESSYTNLNFFGAFGLTEVTGVAGFGIMLLLMLLIINALNLIDGIDGLAASIGVVSLSCFAYIYYQLDEPFFVVLCIGMVGSLLAFLRFNFSTKKKIFMGDTGALILGFIIAVMSVKFLSLSAADYEVVSVVPQHSIFIVIAILVFPFFDMTRVFALRIFNKRNPFLADNNHTHHILLNLGNSHTKSSVLIILFSTIITIFLFLASTKIHNSWLLLGVYALTFLLFYAVFVKFASKKNLE